MNDDFLNRLQLSLVDKFSTDDINTLINEISILMLDYNITLKDTSLVLYTPEKYYIELFLAINKIEGKSNRTIELYANRLIIFFRYTQLCIKDVTANHIRVFLYKYQKDKGVQNCTIEQYRIIICVFFNWCFNDGYISNNPSSNIKEIKCKKKIQQVSSTFKTHHQKGVFLVFKPENLALETPVAQL